jgi:hypothetical protein
MQFLDSRGSQDSSYENTNQEVQASEVPESGITDDDIPF